MPSGKWEVVLTSRVFLTTTYTETVVPKPTGINRCSVAYTLCSKVTLDILEALDARHA